jgi:DNA-binding transcriptional LysR family regulator
MSSTREGLVNLRTLRHFVVVAEEENLHRAAERLHIAQPALTRQIKLLEADLGAVLFERSARGLKLTPAGDSYLADARTILGMAVQASRRAALVDKGFMGTLRLGFHEVAHRYSVFKEVMSRFMREHDDVQFAFHTMSSQQQIDALISGEIDAGFIYLWNALPHQLESSKMRDDSYLVGLAGTHPLAISKTIALSDLADEPFIWVDRSLNSAQSNTLLKACARAGFVPRMVHDGFNSESAMLSLVSIGAGLAFLPASLEETNPPIALRRADGLDVHIELHLAFRSGPRHAVLNRFIEAANDVAGNGGTVPPA